MRLPLLFVGIAVFWVQSVALSPPLTRRERNALGCYRLTSDGGRPVDIALDSVAQPPILAWFTWNERGQPIHVPVHWSSYLVRTRESKEGGWWSWHPNEDSVTDSIHLLFGAVDAAVDMRLARYPDSLVGLGYWSTSAKGEVIRASRLSPCDYKHWHR